MKDKYNLTREQNIFLAKRNIVDYIWKSANLEGITITYPETQSLYDGGIVSGLTVPQPGFLRTTPVNIGGTTWKTEFPFESQIKEELENILKQEEESKTEIAIECMLYIMRRQMFIDGNKRVAMLFANKIMIDNGCGILSIAKENQSIFLEKLIKFYETNNNEDLKEWIYQTSIDGIEL